MYYLLSKAKVKICFDNKVQETLYKAYISEDPDLYPDIRSMYLTVWLRAEALFGDNDYVVPDVSLLEEVDQARLTRQKRVPAHVRRYIPYHSFHLRTKYTQDQIETVLAGGYKERCRLSWLTNSALVYTVGVQMRGEGESCGVSANE